MMIARRERGIFKYSGNRITLSNLTGKIVKLKSLSGLYIHIPFCRKACHYCNFHFSTTLQLKDEMVEALLKEIELLPLDTQFAKPILNTVYFGGGTPSLLSASALKSILEKVTSRFEVNAGAEITLEANPDDLSADQLQAWRKIGINRLSVGIQTFDETELRWMNRAHSAAEALAVLTLIPENGFPNYSIDLIYGSPLLSDEQWAKNVAIAIEHKVPHISCYALTVEPGTALKKMIELKKKQPVVQEKQANHFTALMHWMKVAGYEHYEISNFALPNQRSKHNSSYWQGKPYWGIGPSAHSFNGSSRQWNIAQNVAYINSIKAGKIPFEMEQLTPTQQINEYIMTSIRTLEGIDLNAIENRFGEKYRLELETHSTKYIQSKQLNKTNHQLILSDEGRLFADGIAADLFFE